MKNNNSILLASSEPFAQAAILPSGLNKKGELKRIPAFFAFNEIALARQIARYRFIIIGSLSLNNSPKL